jgi:hypothetical protein
MFYYFYILNPVRSIYEQALHEMKKEAKKKKDESSYKSSIKSVNKSEQSITEFEVYESTLSELKQTLHQLQLRVNFKIVLNQKGCNSKKRFRKRKA